MSGFKSSAGSSPKKKPHKATADKKTCPQCGQPLRAEYTCGCPERWENEGGALAPEERRAPETHKE